jgi:hypothetical protein
MEVPQGNACVAALNKQKCHFFFSFTKSENKRTESCLGTVGIVGEGGGKRVWMGEYSANTVYTCM